MSKRKTVTNDGKPKVEAVIAYARKLRDQAQTATISDPWARPYSPSEATARKLSQTHGPERAIEILRERAATVDGDARRDSERAAESLGNLAVVHAQHAAESRALRSRRSPGQRIDLAIARLSVVSNAPTATMDGDKITGGSSGGSLPYSGDASGWARQLAVELAERLEAVMDGACVRDLAA